MNKLGLILLMIVASNSYGDDCKIKIEKMNAVTGNTTNQSFDFSTVGTEPSREGTTFVWTPYRTFIYEASSTEECDARVKWFIEHNNKKSLKFLSTEFEGEKKVITDKHISSRLLRVANQDGRLLGGFVRYYEITDRVDPEYKLNLILLTTWS